MTVSIIANASARFAQSSLVKQNEEVTRGTLRMSTGQRVLSAADDAAAMAIGTSLRIENAGLKSALLNVTAATSMLQIADGALGQISELLTRMQTLAVQASSGQYDDPTRVLINGEFQGLKQEVDRLAGGTLFNGVNILAGTKDFEITSVGTMAADGIARVRIDPTVVTGDQSFRYSYEASTQNLTVTRIDAGVATAQTMNLAPLLNASVGVGVNLQGSQSLDIGFNQLGITLTLNAQFDRAVDMTNGVTSAPGADMTIATPTFAVGNTNAGLPLLENLIGLPGSDYSAATGLLSLDLASAMPAGTVELAGSPGISYRVNGGAMGASGAASGDFAGANATIEVYADVAGGGTVLLGTIATGAVAATGTGTGTMVLDVGGGLFSAEETGDIAPTHLTYKVGTGVLSGQDTLGVDIPAMTLQALELDTLAITTQGTADAAIDALKAAMTVLSQGRATVGAQQLRLEGVGRNLGVISDNNESARSSLIDVDVSEEITNITTNQSLMQASIAMLSRANQTPDILLRLLEN